MTRTQPTQVKVEWWFTNQPWRQRESDFCAWPLSAAAHPVSSIPAIGIRQEVER